MKIGFVVDDTLDKPDGVQQYVLTLSSWLRDQGHEVHYLVGESKRTDIDHVHSLSKNVKVRFNKNRLSIPLPTSAKRLREFVTTEQFDVLHVQMPHSPFMAAKLIKYAPQATAVVGTFHIAPYSKVETAATKALGILLKKNLAVFDQIISVSQPAQAFAKQTFKIDSIVLPNVIDLKHFKHNLNKNIPSNITFLGRLVERKGAAHLLHALSVMENNHPDTRYSLRFCGDGPDRAKLLELKETLGLTCDFDFTGHITEEQKTQYLSQAGIAVFPSTGGESFGIVLLEAMAAESGVVIAGDNPGYQSVLGSIPECMVNPLDHVTFAETMHRYLSDQSLAKTIHQKQQKLVKQYDVAVVGPQITTIYEEAIAKRRSRKHN